MDITLFRKLICIRCGNPTLEQGQNGLVCTFCGQNVSLHNDIPDFSSVFYMKESAWRGKKWNPDGYESGISRAKPYRLRRIDEPLLQNAHGEVLEIGCGTCRLGTLAEKRGTRYFGLDPVLSFLLYAAEHRGLQRLVCGWGERLPFQDQSFDSIISGYYSYRYVKPELGLPEVRRVLKKGGKFTFDLLSNWMLKLMGLKSKIIRGKWKALRSFQWAPPPDAFEFVSLSQLRKKVEKAGFLIESVTSTPIIPFSEALNKLVSGFYYRGRRTIYLGYDIIIVLRAV